MFASAFAPLSSEKAASCTANPSRGGAPEWSLPEILATAAELGYDGLEPRIDAQHQHGLEVSLSAAGRADARRQAAAAGVELACLATSLQFIKVASPDRETLLEETAARIELAADLGIPGLRVFAGGLPAGTSLDDGLAAAADNLHHAAELAGRAGVELWLETHDTVSKAVLAAKIVRGANHPAAKINYDVMHPYRYGETLAETFAALEGLVRHTHFHDSVASANEVTITRFGAGQLPLVEMLSWLKLQGFTGYLSGEWFEQQLGATPRESLEHYLAGTKAVLAQVP